MAEHENLKEGSYLNDRKESYLTAQNIREFNHKYSITAAVEGSDTKTPSARNSNLETRREAIYEEIRKIDSIPELISIGQWAKHKYAQLPNKFTTEGMLSSSFYLSLQATVQGFTKEAMEKLNADRKLVVESLVDSKKKLTQIVNGASGQESEAVQTQYNKAIHTHDELLKKGEEIDKRSPKGYTSCAELAESQSKYLHQTIPQTPRSKPASKSPAASSVYDAITSMASHYYNATKKLFTFRSREAVPPGATRSLPQASSTDTKATDTQTTTSRRAAIAKLEETSQVKSGNVAPDSAGASITNHTRIL